MRNVIFALVACTAPIPALACGVCMFAAGDYLAPPIYLWTILVLLLFVANGVLRSSTGLPLPLQPRLPASAAMAIALFVFATVAPGPFVIMPLAIPPLLAAVKSHLDPQRGDRTWRPVRLFGIATIATLAILATTSTSIRQRRTDAEFVLNWPASVHGRAVFRRLISATPAPVEQLRVLALNGTVECAVPAAERLAEVSRGSSDLAVLRNCRKRFSGDPKASETLDQAILKLSGAAP